MNSSLKGFERDMDIRPLEHNASLQEKLIELEQLKQQVQESLEHRTRQVKTSTEIAQKIAATPDLDDLFRRVVNLVQEQFGYYHVHVYTLEDGNLIMQEGTGDPGRKLKEFGHKIALDAKRSLVAQAARSGEPVLTGDVAQERGWLPNPLLPETKAEIAVPIKLDNEILGVLDVQNDTIGSLSREDQILLMGLCGQIAVAINNRRLEAKRKQAEEAQKNLIEELDAFAYTVGHNLRDPLALIIGYADLLKEHARLPEELQDYLNAIARNGRKMSNTIDELQLLAGVQKAKVELKPLNMARIVAEVQQRLVYLIEEHQAKIIVSGYWPEALGHTPWVEEVWANYLGNAIKYGGRPPCVQVGATAQSDGMIRFWVRDNGPGLTPEEQAQLFTGLTPLSQTRVKGYALGLSIVRRIITKLGGQRVLESDVGQGSTFTFTLPGANRTDSLSPHFTE
jgi:signal transduction histidine kinase